MKRDGLTLLSTSNLRRRWGKIYEESEQGVDKEVGHSTSFQNSARVSNPSPPNKARESESDIVEPTLGIFPDIPDAGLKEEFDEGICFVLSEEGINEDSMYITAEADGSELKNPYLEIKEEKSEECLLGIKMEVFPDSHYVVNDALIKNEFNSNNESPRFDLSEGAADDVTFNSKGLARTGTGSQVAAEFDDTLLETSNVKVEEGEGPMLETEPIIKMEVFPDDQFVQAKMEWDSGNEDSNDSKLHSQQVPEPLTTAVEAAIPLFRLYPKPDPKVKLICAECNVLFGSRSQLWGHKLRTHKPEKLAEFKCKQKEGCTFQGHSKKDLFRHQNPIKKPTCPFKPGVKIRSVRRRKSYKTRCPDCLQVFSSSNHLEAHKRSRFQKCVPYGLHMIPGVCGTFVPVHPKYFEEYKKDKAKKKATSIKEDCGQDKINEG